MLSLTLCVAHDVATATQQSSSVARDQGNRCHMAGRDVLWGIHCIIDTTRGCSCFIDLRWHGIVSTCPTSLRESDWQQVDTLSHRAQRVVTSDSATVTDTQMYKTLSASMPQNRAESVIFGALYAAVLADLSPSNSALQPKPWIELLEPDVRQSWKSDVLPCSTSHHAKQSS
jgi:hypothetical protein